MNSVVELLYLLCRSHIRIYKSCLCLLVSQYEGAHTMRGSYSKGIWSSFISVAVLKYPDLGEEGFTQFTITGRVHNCMKSGLQTASHTTSKVKRLAEYGQSSLILSPQRMLLGCVKLTVNADHHSIFIGKPHPFSPFLFACQKFVSLGTSMAVLHLSETYFPFTYAPSDWAHAHCYAVSQCLQ